VVDLWRSQCLRDLSRNPIDEGIEKFEANRWDNEQVHSGNVRRVVMQEGPPSLAGRPSLFDHVLVGCWVYSPRCLTLGTMSRWRRCG
jgi:hypothetical protein